MKIKNGRTRTQNSEILVQPFHVAKCSAASGRVRPPKKRSADSKRFSKENMMTSRSGGFYEGRSIKEIKYVDTIPFTHPDRTLREEQSTVTLNGGRDHRASSCASSPCLFRVLFAFNVSRNGRDCRFRWTISKEGNTESPS